VVSTYTPPRHKVDKEGGGKKKGHGLASKPWVGKALHRHRKVSYYSTATLRRLCKSSCLAALSCFGLACEPNVEGFAIFDLACGEPFVSLGAFALPSYAILYLLCADAPRARKHVRICAEGQLRAQSPMRRSAGLTGRWHGDARSSATSATPIQLPTHSDRSPPPTARISPKLGRNIEHWWYDRSPANRSATIPRSPAITQDIYQWIQGSHSARGHSGLKQTTSQVQSSAGRSTLQIRATPDVARCVTRPKSEI
jgi:hypothetical protein